MMASPPNDSSAVPTNRSPNDGWFTLSMQRAAAPPADSITLAFSRTVSSSRPPLWPTSTPRQITSQRGARRAVDLVVQGLDPRADARQDHALEALRDLRHLALDLGRSDPRPGPGDDSGPNWHH